jgi:HK97 family phage portal protein
MRLLDRLYAFIGGGGMKAIVPYAGGAVRPGWTGGVVGDAGWMPLLQEPFSGAWQRNMEAVNPALAATYYADFACKTLIARDIAKMPLRLMRRDKDGIWEVEENNGAYSPVLRKPNAYQTRIQFWETYILSKLSHGNTYVLKERDGRGVVKAMYVLDPRRVRPLIAEDKSVFYELYTDDLNINEQNVVVPAREIIHDRFNCDHWLVGRPPIVAGGLAAMQGLQIQNMSVRLFRNNSQPGGVLTAPGNVSEADVERIRTHWQQRFTGENLGKVAVLGSGLKYEQMTFTAEQAQLIEQLKWSAENICSTYHVPPYKISVGVMPSYNNVQALNVEYYTQCLQSLIEDAEVCMDEGLGLTSVMDLGVEFDLDVLLRMDTAAQADVAVKLVGGSILKVNEGRKRFNLKPATGGDAIYMQQQNYSLDALAKRDAKDDPFKTAAPPTPEPAEEEDDEPIDDEEAEGLDEDKLKLLALLMDPYVTPTTKTRMPQ